MVTVFTGKDVVNPREEALHLLQQSRTEGYDTLLERHNRRWEELWKHAEVKIRGDVKAMEAVNYSIYHLQSIAPRHTDSLSIPARGLSGQTYKGCGILGYGDVYAGLFSYDRSSHCQNIDEIPH